MTQKQPTLTGERLILRPFKPSDAPDIQRLAGDFAIADTTLNLPHPYEDGMAEDWISTHREAFEAGTDAFFAVTLRETGELVGAMTLMDIRSRFQRAELGYWIGRPYWGRGYATEAARAMLAYGFQELKLNRIFATHFVRNPASGRVMEKIGMICEGGMRQHAKRWDDFEDFKLYGILRSEFEAKQYGHDLSQAE